LSAWQGNLAEGAGIAAKGMGMAKQEHGGQGRATRREDETDAPEPEGAPADAQARQEKLTEDVDSMLDEIDDVLEENAEEFVRAYVQKGGQ
jgi:prokaryotic ubiquitin-like protein Pup